LLSPTPTNRVFIEVLEPRRHSAPQASVFEEAEIVRQPQHY
jgi:hypothetical protein